MIIEIQMEKRGSLGERVRRGRAEVRGREKVWRMKWDLNCACNTQDGNNALLTRKMVRAVPL